MPLLTRLKISNVRNIKSADLQLSPGFNLFFGNNGAGKTSVLEAVSLLSIGRSFRSNKARFLIQNGEESATVFSELSHLESEGQRRSTHKLGIAKFRSDQSKVRIDGEVSGSASELARLLPVLTVEPNSFQLLEGGPVQRRAVLDWLVFHVKRDFFSAYKDYKRCLKQRNILLRSDRISRFDLKAWDSLLCDAALLIDAYRAEVAERLRSLLTHDFFAELDGLALELRFRSGWSEKEGGEGGGAGPNKENYLRQLDASFERDRRMGYTTLGSHRHDVEFKVAGQPAADVLSRGQKKQLIVCLFLAMAKMFQKEKAQCPVLLLDDLVSELDKDKLHWLFGFIQALGAQTLITAIDAESIENLITVADSNASLFHVKHGVVTAKTTME